MGREIVMAQSRREFLAWSAAVSAGFAGLRRAVWAAGGRLREPEEGYGELVKDATGILDLPRGFRYSIVSRVGDTMDDGLLVPGKPDGMGAFSAADGLTVLVRNHEMEPIWAWGSPFGENNRLLGRVPAEKVFDRGRGERPCLGGTTTVHFNTRTQRVERQYMSLVGTCYNCAGGQTPWGTWLTCEETTHKAGGPFERDHGWVFEVPASAAGPVDPVPYKAMGRFRHEACAVRPENSVVYMTEDVDNGLLYRFLPRRAGRLMEGGRLQAMAAEDSGVDVRNWDAAAAAIPIGAKTPVRWIDLEEVESPEDDLRVRGFAAGALRFARGEGMWYGDGAAYFVSTTGGREKVGQLWRYTPAPADVEGAAAEAGSPGMLELFLEPDDARVMENPDNIAMSPWGDLIVCEDGPGEQYLLGVTPGGRVYRLARNAIGKSEFAGCVFSPDGTTLFVNLQGNGLTLAVTGPWRRPM